MKHFTQDLFVNKILRINFSKFLRLCATGLIVMLFALGALMLISQTERPISMSLVGEPFKQERLYKFT